MMRNIDAKFKKPYNNCNLRKIIYHQYLPMFMSIFNLMGAQTDRFRYEVFQNLFLSPMNTVFLRDAVATVLTVYGIETYKCCKFNHNIGLLQQYLPFTVLKLPVIMKILNIFSTVATVLTVYGIETCVNIFACRCNSSVATVLTVYGIETQVILCISVF